MEDALAEMMVCLHVEVLLGKEHDPVVQYGIEAQGFIV